MSHMKDKTVSVVGLGYVGLPLADAFSKHLKVIGFDVDRAKIEELNKNFFAKQKPLLKRNKVNLEFTFTAAPSKIKQADFVIIAVPTPVTKSNLI